MEITECKASLRSQCPQDWLKTEVETIRKKQSIII
jgi:hypothetical protein